MRTEVLINELDASVSQSGIYEVDCGQDMRWLLMVRKTGTNGTPKAYLEESSNGVDWVALSNNDINAQLDYFPLSDQVTHIRDSYFMGKSFRIRVEPNNNTTGTVYAELVVKTKSN